MSNVSKLPLNNIPKLDLKKKPKPKLLSFSASCVLSIKESRFLAQESFSMHLKQHFLERCAAEWERNELTEVVCTASKTIRTLLVFRSNENHQQADWVGIHKRICQLLIPIRTETKLSFQSESHVELQLQKVRVNLRHQETRVEKYQTRSAVQTTRLGLEST